MSIESQIEAAWKEYKPEALSTNSMALSHDVFTAGYLAALRSLYRDATFEELTDWWNNSEDDWDTPFYGFVDGECVPLTVTWVDDDYRACKKGGRVPCKPTRIICQSENLPSPSDIFGRGE